MSPAAATSRSPAQSSVEVDGVRVAYRASGEHHEGVPLLLLHRFRATMDDWDPALIEALATARRVIAFDSLGVGESGGATPATLEEAADFAALLVRTLENAPADFLGWSMGGMTAQILALRHPTLVRRLVLAGTLPPGGTPEVVPSPPAWSQIAGKPDY